MDKLKLTLNKDLPPTKDWARLRLPNTWPDGINFKNPAQVAKLAKHLFSKRKPVVLPDNLPGLELIPQYVRQEFHQLPNGNYSNKITRGYINAFDASMLGTMQQQRKNIAKTLESCHRVLDAGCAGGSTAKAIYDRKSGVNNNPKEVWGLDPSPYLLKHAATAYPQIKFVQGIIEDIPFPDGYFDGISACFLMHEVPPKYIRAGLKEFHRVLAAKGKIIVVEPSPEQLKMGTFQLIKKFGWHGFYFGLLAKKVHEPFVHAWHKLDFPVELAECNFQVSKVYVDFPTKVFIAEKAG